MDLVRLDPSALRCKPLLLRRVPGFDLLLFRMEEEPDPDLQAFLKAHSHHSDRVPRKSAVRHSPRKVLWTVIAPDRLGVARIAQQDNQWDVVQVEAADNTITDNRAQADRFQLLHDEHAVSPWGPAVTYSFHGRYGRTSYIGAKGDNHQVVCYADAECKFTGARHCCHREVRINGAEALAQHGIRSPKDLLTFNHDRFWKWFDASSYFRMDLHRLGRWLDNREKGCRRQKPWLRQIHPGLVHNMDLRRGAMLTRRLEYQLHLRIKHGEEYLTDYEQHQHLLQALVNELGREHMPWLTPITSPFAQFPLMTPVAGVVEADGGRGVAMGLAA